MTSLVLSPPTPELTDPSGIGSCIAPCPRLDPEGTLLLLLPLDLERESSLKGDEGMELSLLEWLLLLLLLLLPVACELLPLPEFVNDSSDKSTLTLPPDVTPERTLDRFGVLLSLEVVDSGRACAGFRSTFGRGRGELLPFPFSFLDPLPFPFPFSFLDPCPLPELLPNPCPCPEPFPLLEPFPFPNPNPFPELFLCPEPSAERARGELGSAVREDRDRLNALNILNDTGVVGVFGCIAFAFAWVELELGIGIGIGVGFELEIGIGIWNTESVAIGLLPGVNCRNSSIESGGGE